MIALLVAALAGQRGQPARPTSGLAADRLADVRRRHPPLWVALVADAKTTAAYRRERHEFRSNVDALGQILRLMAVSDAFLAQAAYRLKARLQALGVPVLPRLAHRAAIVLGQVSIGDPVVVAPGLYLLHGQVVIDGFTEIGAHARIGPFVTIGLRHSSPDGPVISSGVSIGTGAKVLGNVRIGRRASIGANAVVLTDVPAGATATGVPATVHDQSAGDAASTSG
jgi:serine O-acetyltransferase